MRTLYPDISPYAEYWLDVDSTHRLYVEESGNPSGIPVIFIHGGPGGGTSAAHRSFFNPERYRIILFDQRGCGRSTPHASLENNTTADLVQDMEKIRDHLNIDTWLLFGGSWGSTLALAYGQAHPERVSGMILRGIFLCRKQDIDWFYQQGASALFPDYWADYLQPIPVDERQNLLQAYYQRLTSDNEIARMAAAKAWSIWEGRCSTLHPNQDIAQHFGEPHVALAMARIEAHYFYHGCFMRENQLIEDAGKLRDIPITLVHGRYDVVCPIEQAFALHQVLPHAEFNIIRDAGHSAFEPGITDNLIRATDRFARQQA
ncbi:Proline iminopeptidase [Nitrincola lacisaponensis]|uniref:Proline iminopeptidase n=1 Tax=Nitrincola lacisaponensis TaxID=267850 RepID=A0A063Y4D6_9GAMM|nr:prolyl aminopeptidase [Nitrincola lacisaponensis]KDE39636.1 Proline iminopeptidase [Nitrincola lacisaponensis]